MLSLHVHCLQIAPSLIFWKRNAYLSHISVHIYWDLYKIGTASVEIHSCKYKFHFLSSHPCTALWGQKKCKWMSPLNDVRSPWPGSVKSWQFLLYSSERRITERNCSRNGAHFLVYNQWHNDTNNICILIKQKEQDVNYISLRYLFNENLASFIHFEKFWNQLEVYSQASKLLLKPCQRLSKLLLIIESIIFITVVLLEELHLTGTEIKEDLS